MDATVNAARKGAGLPPMSKQQQMDELKKQMKDPKLTDAERAAIQKKMDELMKEMNKGK
jgi:hypothetical protein